MLRVPAAMLKMKIRLLDDEAQLAATTMAGLSVIHLQENREVDQELPELPAMEFHDKFYNIKSRYKKILSVNEQDKSTSLSFETTLTEDKLTLEQLTDMDEKLRQLWSEVSALEERQRQLKEQLSSVKQLQISLQRFLSLEIDLSRFGRKSLFLNVMVGTVATSNRARLEKALSLIGYILTSFDSNQGNDHIIIVGACDHTEDVRDLLKSADFRELSLPDAFKDKPQMIKQELQQQEAEIERLTKQTDQNLSELISQHKSLLNDVCNLLQNAMPYASLAGFLKGKGSLVSFQGWVPKARQHEIRSSLEEKLNLPFQLVFEEPSANELEQVPTKLKENKWVMPFQSLVRQYGLPQYGEFDPGLLFALSYTLMFGMMFGDVGHGAVFILLAWFFRKPLGSLAYVGMMAGSSSIIFGVLFGSVFGFESLLHPLWMSPMSDPQYVLTLALYWGIGFLLIANLLSLRNLLYRKKITQALYSPQGAAGVLFYLTAALSLIWVLESNSGLPGWSIPTLTLLMMVLLYYQWLQSSGSLFERILVVFIEGLEIIISNLSGTLSFLRVGAFALNHIALAAAVFALASMMDTFGHWVAIVLGNIFIIVLEGAIVAIQCLRLEYYEGFSRYFSGLGKPYQPLKRNFDLN